MKGLPIDHPPRSLEWYAALELVGKPPIHVERTRMDDGTKAMQVVTENPLNGALMTLGKYSSVTIDGKRLAPPGMYRTDVEKPIACKLDGTALTCWSIDLDDFFPKNEAEVRKNIALLEKKRADLVDDKDGTIFTDLQSPHVDELATLFSHSLNDVKRDILDNVWVEKAFSSAFKKWPDSVNSMRWTSAIGLYDEMYRSSLDGKVEGKDSWNTPARYSGGKWDLRSLIMLAKTVKEMTNPTAARGMLDAHLKRIEFTTVDGYVTTRVREMLKNIFMPSDDESGYGHPFEMRGAAVMMALNRGMGGKIPVMFSHNPYEMTREGAGKERGIVLERWMDKWPRARMLITSRTQNTTSFWNDIASFSVEQHDEITKTKHDKAMKYIEMMKEEPIFTSREAFATAFIRDEGDIGEMKRAREEFVRSRQWPAPSGK